MPVAQVHKTGRFRRLALPCALAALSSCQGIALAQPVAAPLPPALPPLSAQPWPGLITLEVDATDLDHRLLQVRQTLPVKTPGKRLTLLFPRWLPGTHGPSGDVTQLAGLTITGAGQPLRWQRDTVDAFAFHVDVPPGVPQLTLQFQHLSPLNRGEGRREITDHLLGVQWNQTVLYPAGTAASALQVQAQLKLPAGWQQGSALRGPDGQPARVGVDGWVRYRPTSLETLVDSPVFAGAFFQRVELDPPGTPQAVALNLVADEAAQLEATPTQLDAHRALVRQATALFGRRHFRQYDFLLAQSSSFSGIGLEHQESSENGTRPGYFKEWDKRIGSRELLPHELVHSWNGKFRRPADLWTANYNQPMRNSLLWLYEGQTQFWGHVLAARSGLSTPEQARDRLAMTAARLDSRAGRQWRNLQDTTNENTMGARGQGKSWWDWQRGAEYYDEATLIWLDADSLIREKSGDTRSLDDFAKAFFGVPHTTAVDGAVLPLTYTFDDVVAALNAVQPMDWAAFLRTRLDRVGPGAPLDGLARSGWQLAWTNTESKFAKGGEDRDGGRSQDLNFSLGLSIKSDGKLDYVAWQGPAFQAGLAPGMSLLAVNMQAYTPERLAAAITANQDGQHPIGLLVRQDDQFRQVSINWRGGLRYPQLQRVEGTPDRLSTVYAPRP
jgi:predicted metalloprotease with PDZ domain